MSKMEKLPEGWVLRESQDYPGRCYYYNQDTKFSCWERPPNDGSMFLQQIIIKYKGSVNPVDRKGETIERTYDEAQNIALEVRKKLDETPDKFEELAEQYSDIYDKESHSYLGWINPANYKNALHSMPAKIELNEITKPVYSRIGFHILRRLG